MKSFIILLKAKCLLVKLQLVNFLIAIIDKIYNKINIQFVKNLLTKFRNKLVYNNVNFVDGLIISGIAFLMLLKFRYFSLLAFATKYLSKTITLHKNGKKMTTEIVSYTIWLSAAYAVMWQFQPNIVMTLVMTWLFMSY